MGLQLISTNKIFLFSFTSIIMFLLMMQKMRHTVPVRMENQLQICKAKQKIDVPNNLHGSVDDQIYQPISLRKTFVIAWFEVLLYLQRRPLALSRGFDVCEFNNCVITDEKHCLEKSDAVLFKGAHLPEKYPYKRPYGQVWIFAEDECPFYYKEFGEHYKNHFWKSAFNWTMTYNKYNTDIYLPNGEIWKRKTLDNRDFLTIAQRKTKDALIITSRCKTDSKRELFIQKLKKYIKIDTLGRCGREWKCGSMYVHDDCFNILNYSYKFYLAFENSLCKEYVTEKFFENYNYDLLLVYRAGKGTSTKEGSLPQNVYIDATGYNSAHDLGRYLQQLASNATEYAKLLRRKSQYYFPGFQEVYQRALCNICERLNRVEHYRQQIPDIEQWLWLDEPCIKSEDIEIS